MMIGLMPSGTLTHAKRLDYGLAGLASLSAFLGQIPPVSLCKDASGNVVDCGSTPGPGGSGCDPTFVAMGYQCYVDAAGNVTYVPAGGQAPAPPPQGSAAGKPGGSPTGSASGTCTGPNCNTQCLGIFGMTSLGQWICQHKTALLIGGVVFATLLVREKV